MCPISESRHSPGETSLEQSTPQQNNGKNLKDLIPDSELCNSAYDWAKKTLFPAIFNHSLRVYLFAKWLTERDNSEWAKGQGLELLFVSCIGHDIGTANEYNGDQRFEVEGADAAVNLLHSHGISEDRAHQVWIAIALHSSAGIAERITSLARYVRLAVLIDFRPATRTELGANEMAEQIERILTRLNIEKVLGDAVVDQALKKPQKAPSASWPGLLLRGHLADPSWQGVNREF